MEQREGPPLQPLGTNIILDGPCIKWSIQLWIFLTSYPISFPFTHSIPGKSYLPGLFLAIRLSTHP